MSSHNASQPLAPRDVNAPLSPSKSSSKPSEDKSDDKPKSMEYHRQVLQSRLAEDSSKQVYVSPSDNILSPCTKKLNDYKSKHFSKAKPQSLFAKMKANEAQGSNVNGGKASDDKSGL